MNEVLNKRIVCLYRVISDQEFSHYEVLKVFNDKGEISHKVRVEAFNNLFREREYAAGFYSLDELELWSQAISDILGESLHLLSLTEFNHLIEGLGDVESVRENLFEQGKEIHPIQPSKNNWLDKIRSTIR